MPTIKIAACLPVLMFICAAVSCDAPAPNSQREGMLVDSCLVKVGPAPGSDSTMLNLVVSFQTLKPISRDSVSKTMLLMEQYFELTTGGQQYAASFCQPIAAANNNRQDFWIAFETNATAAGNSRTLRILPNLFVKDTINYPL
jgi:hypothetical protein